MWLVLFCQLVEKFYWAEIYLKANNVWCVRIAVYLWPWRLNSHCQVSTPLKILSSLMCSLPLSSFLLQPAPCDQFLQPIFHHQKRYLAETRFCFTCPVCCGRTEVAAWQSGCSGSVEVLLLLVQTVNQFAVLSFPRSVSPADGWFSFCVLCSPELVSRCLIVSLSERSGCSCFILARWIRPSALQRLKFCCYSAVLSFWPGGFIHFPPFICVFVNLQRGIEKYMQCVCLSRSPLQLVIPRSKTTSLAMLKNNW